MTQIAAALFAWDAVEARSDLERFYPVRDHLPGRDLIAALDAKRDLGRDDYPVHSYVECNNSWRGFST